MTAQDEKLVEPLRSVVVFVGGFLLIGFLAAAVLAVSGRGGSVGGFGDVTICVTQPNTGYDVPNNYPPGDPWVVGRPGTTISIDGVLHACASHPGLGQRFWYTLMSLPDALVWAGVLFLLWRLTVAARRFGPFTVQVAAGMRVLGWFILIGSVAAAALHGFAVDALLNSMLRDQNDFGDSIPLHGSLFVPVLAAAVLLTFARFTRVGVAMDEEIKGTV